MDKKAMNDLEDYMIDELELKTKINDIWKM